MIPDEWQAISLLIENCWRGEFDDTRSASYFAMLRQFDPEDVMAALHAIIENGSPFIPSVPEIVVEIRKFQTPPLPSWSEVWDRIQYVLRRCLTEDEAVELLNELHPVAGAFLRTEGFERLQHEPLLDPDYGALRVRELHQRWREFSEVKHEKMRQGMAIESRARSRNGLTQFSAAGLIAEVSEDASEGETI